VMGGKKKYIEMFGSFTEPFICFVTSPSQTKFFTDKCSSLISFTSALITKWNKTSSQLQL